MRTKIIILATLHQFHEKCKFYSLEHLKTIIEKIDPDVICVELTAEDLKTPKEQAVKVEYPHCIIPLAERRGYKLVPMEPDEPEYSRIVNMYSLVEKEAESKEPYKIEIFNLYVKALYDYLFTYRNSPADVNSQLTNALFEVKHEFQNSLYGQIEKQCWNEWNTHFLKAILDASKTYKGKKILVTVGAEHVYWLKKQLQNNSEIDLVEVDELLNK